MRCDQLFRRNSPTMRILRDRRAFRVFWLGSVASQIGDRFHNLAIIVYIYSLSGSAKILGQFLAYSAATSLIAGPLLAVFVDRLPAKKTLVIVDLTRAVVVGSIPFIPGILGVYIAAALLAVLDVFYSPAYHTLFPRLIQKDELLAANSINATSDRLAQMLIPSIGGLMVAVLGPKIGFFTNAASFVISAAAVASLRLDDKPVSEARTSKKGTSYWADFADGLKVVGGSPKFRVMLAVLALVTISLSINNALILPFVTEVMAKGTREYGFLTSALAGGLLVGSLAVGQTRGRLRSGLLPVALAMVGTGLTGLALLRTMAGVATARIVLGLGLAYYGVTFQTEMQQESPDGKRGRVSAIFHSTGDAVGVISLGLAGTISAALGIPGMFVIAGGLAMLASLSAGLLLRYGKNTAEVSTNAH